MKSVISIELVFNKLKYKLQDCIDTFVFSNIKSHLTTQFQIKFCNEIMLHEY